MITRIDRATIRVAVLVGLATAAVGCAKLTVQVDLYNQDISTTQPPGFKMRRNSSLALSRSNQ